MDSILVDLDVPGTISAAVLAAIDRWWAAEQHAWRQGCLHQVCQALREAAVKGAR